MLKYLKLYTDFAEETEELTDVEFGRLMRAMLTYARNGSDPELRGNERYVWKRAKMQIDAQKEAYENVCTINKRIANERVTERDGASRSVTEDERSVTERDKTKPKTKTKTKTKDIAPIPPSRFDEFWSVYPKHKAKQDAERAWGKLKPNDELAETIILDIKARRSSPDWNRDDGRYVPNAATYLNGRRWLDEDRTDDAWTALGRSMGVTI